MKTKSRAGNKRTKKDAAVSVGSGRMVRVWLAANGAPKPGRIHLYCPTCGRTKKNMRRCDGDLPNAAVLLTQCPKCNRGDFSLADYLDIRGHDASSRRAKP